MVTWTTIDASPSAGTFSGTLSSIPEGGWYNIQVRFSNDTGVTDNGSNAFGVGILVATSGQSNMRDWYTEGADTANDLLRVFDGTSWTAPTKNGAVTFGNTIISSESVPVGLIDGSVDGSALNSAAAVSDIYWLNTASSYPYDDLLIDITAAGGQVEYVVFGQGERDAQVGITQAQYAADLATLATNFRNDVTSGYHATLPMLVIGLGRYDVGDDADWQAIRDAQIDACAADANMYLAAQTIDLEDRDGIHLDTTSLTEAGLRTATTVLYILGSKSYYQGPEIQGFYLVDSSTIDVVMTHNGGSDFTPTSGITGFEVFDDATGETISTAVRQSASIIRLTLSGSISGTPTARYLYGASPANTAPVVDNTTETIGLQYNTDMEWLSAGDITYGHDTSVEETYVENFTNRWTGTGTISGSGDSEKISMTTGEYMESPIIYTGSSGITLLQGKYTTADTVTIKYKTGATVAAVQAASFSTYSAPFSSTGFVQIRLESTL